MKPDEALRSLTPSRIRDTIIVLEALDCLQAHAWDTRFESQVRDRVPHGEAILVTMGNKALKDFVFAAPSANAQGLNMNIRSFVNGLNLAGADDQTQIALEACSHTNLSL